MTNFEYLTEDIKRLEAFIRKNDIALDCDTCSRSGIICNNDCTGNLIYFLNLKHIEDNTNPNGIGEEEWSKYVTMFHSILIKLDTPTQLDINYVVNVFERWIEDDKELSEAQKQILLDCENRYKKSLESYARLRGIFSQLKEL